jgi:hypothetical protein
MNRNINRNIKENPMNLKNLKILAGASAVALTLALNSSPLRAAGYEMDSGTAIPIPFDTTVLETVTVNTTNLAFGNVAVHQDTVGTADLVISPLGVITQSLVGPARFVSDGVGKAAATVTLTAAFPSTDIYVDYNTPVNLSCALCVGPPPVLNLIKVTDNLNAPPTGVGHTATLLDVLVPGNTVEGRGTTTAGGALTWDIGATIRTTPSATYYSTGLYTGSFDMILSY